jgi:2-C-methyl-D-erythritol 4-phosphate cytidylyltransferase
MNTNQRRCWGVLPAAGIGSRMGGELPKQYLELSGATLLEHSLRSLLASEQVTAVMVALHPDDRHWNALALSADKRVHTTVGGAERSDSVLAALVALGALADDEDWVLVHDAARPCLQLADLDALIDTVTGTGIGGILAEPVVDTVKLADGQGRVQRTLDREALWRAQTPQMFALGALRGALAAARNSGLAVTDEAAAMEMAEQPVQLVTGSSRNLKVTVPTDLELADWYLSRGGNRCG